MVDADLMVVDGHIHDCSAYQSRHYSYQLHIKHHLQPVKNGHVAGGFCRSAYSCILRSFPRCPSNRPDFFI